jgi:hypothetical protein
MFSKKLPSSNSNRVVSHQKQLLLSGQISYVQIVQYYYIVPLRRGQPSYKATFSLLREWSYKRDYCSQIYLNGPELTILTEQS